MSVADASLPQAAEAAGPRPLRPVLALLTVFVVAAMAIIFACIAGFFFAALINETGFSDFWSEIMGSEDRPGLSLPTEERISAFIILFIEVFSALLVAAVVAIRADGNFRSLLAMNANLPLRLLLIGVALLVVYLAGLELLQWLYPPLEARIKEYCKLPADRAALWIFALGIVLAAPVCEEIIFRGFLQTSLRTWWGPRIAFFFVAGLFSLIHFDLTFLYPLITLPGALVLGWAREASGSIAIPLILHFLINAAAFVSLLLF